MPMSSLSVISATRLPSEVNWKIMLSASFLAGIGFTMSIFVAGLALQENLLREAKIGTLLGSSVSAILGCVLLLIFMPKGSNSPARENEQNPISNNLTSQSSPANESKLDEAENVSHDDGGPIPFQEKRL
jgi:hypothetical protein